MDEITGGNSEDKITRVLFCGLDYSASQNYTREYLQKHPFIQVLLFVAFVCSIFDMCLTFSLLDFFENFG
jgi:hypothetical protein